MIDGTYKISAQTPIGKKKGTLTLTSNGPAVHAVLKAGILGTHEADGTVAGNTFTFSGEVKIPVKGSFSYELEGYVDGNTLGALCKTGRGDIVVEGTRA